MRSISRGVLALLVLATFGLAACDNTTNDTNTPTTPTTTVTETFTGTVNVNGAVVHTFTVSTGGTVTATLTAITPEGTVAGLSLGTWNGALCSVVLANDNAVQANVLTGAVSSIGALCVRVSDTGKFTAQTDYTITVVHP